LQRAARAQHWNRRRDLRNDRRLGRRSDGNSATAAPFQELDHGIALMRIQGTELVLHVDTGLAADVEQVFRLEIQLARQGKNTDFVLQAELLYSPSES
jgi:hypothetical protein